jgi:hypothetical protein
LSLVKENKQQKKSERRLINFFKTKNQKSQRNKKPARISYQKYTQRGTSHSDKIIKIFPQKMTLIYKKENISK